MDNGALNLNCPLCNKDDQVRRVKSIFEVGVSDSETSTQGSHLSGFSFSGNSVIFSGIASGIISLFSRGQSVSKLSSTLSPPPFPKKYPGPISSVISFLTVGLLIYFILVLLTPLEYNSNALIPISIFLIVLGIVNGKRNLAKYERELELAQKMYTIWDRLYYCQRDHLVFDPITRIHNDADKIHEIYFQILGHKGQGY